MRSKGSAKELEALRKRAVLLVTQGRTQASVAYALGIHPSTIAKWMARHRSEGDSGLTAKPTPGRPKFLNESQEQQVHEWLMQKPTELGFRTDLWTAARVAQLIQQRLGVSFHPSYLREWLTNRGYSPQRPQKRARQKNEETIAGWIKHDWPRIQKKRKTVKPTSS